jgi:hypothetical protein
MQSVIYRSTTGVRPAVHLATGPKYITLVWMDAAGIRLHKLPRRDERYMTPTGYPVKKFARRLLQAGKRFGITKGARAALRA